MHAEDVARLLRHGFSFESRGRGHRFVGYRSGFELQDALHETFRRAFEPKARRSYDGVRPYGPYLRTIARNVVLATFRARQTLFPAPDDDNGPRAPELSGPDATSPELTLEQQQIRGLVSRFLDELDPEDRRLLELRFVDGRSQRDVAASLGIGRQRVRGREARLRQRLMAYLRARGERGLVPGALVPLLGLEICRVFTEAVR
jgi:RNA polymerase sigma-70 factor (ECF subfamily)